MTGAGVYVDGGPNTLVAGMGYTNSRRYFLSGSR